MKVITREDLYVAQLAIARATTPRPVATLPDGPVIVVGIIDDDAIAWLAACGATIIDGGGVTLIVLPERAIVENRSHLWFQFTVSVYDDDCVEIAPGLVLEVYADDARHTRATLACAKVA